mmetsp:Transcript_94320/g.177476  ORF Transcript_94320/g.177476 Transcript_94320/m.177476 type:complete len:243 (+) Transcript_94320:71-799(+)
MLDAADDPWADTAHFGGGHAGDSPTFRSSLGHPLRLLCLHGGGENSQAMEFRMRPLQRLLGSDVEITCLDGGLPWQGAVDPDIRSMFGESDGKKIWGWYGTSEDAAGGLSYSGVEQSIFRIERFIEDHGPFDVLVGFSQGCSMITLLTATLSQAGDLPWRANLLCNGVPPKDGRYDHLFTAGLEVPSVHVLGKADPHYALGLKLKDMYSRSLVVEHNEGHKLPDETPVTQAIAAALQRLIIS